VIEESRASEHPMGKDRGRLGGRTAEGAVGKMKVDALASKALPNT